jgi:DNA-directed RNA polymerase specialized sigma24 family protein
MGIVPTPESDRRRFWIKVEKTPVCWLWTAARFENGYGAFRLNNKQRRAHIVSYEWLVGPTNGLQVCHSCDVKHCVRPEHLFLGTQSDNIIDMFQKGRQRERRGEISNWAKLTEDEVREIRRLYADDGLFQREIADMFDITQGAVSQIVLRKHWSHVV